MPQPLSRLDAAYFTLTTFTTTGFGDVTPKSDAAQVAVLIQMATGFLILAVVLALVLSRVVLTWRDARQDGGIPRSLADPKLTDGTETGY